MPISKLRPTFTFDQDRIAQLRALAPEAFADGKINWDVLKEALGENLEDESPNAEHFGLFWPGKREARRFASKPSSGTLIPAPGEGVDEETTHNLFIEGDNLEVLKLLQKSYAGQVKMIYIDPPYNRGSDLIYADNFTEALSDYLKNSGQLDAQGSLLTTNPKSDGRFHSRWLNMMYPRLRIAKNLLTNNGVIFVSIDDNEFHNLRAMMNEIFGEENFVSVIAVVNNLKGRNDRKHVATTHEYLLMYAQPLFESFGLPLTEEQKAEFKYEDQRGQKYALRDLRRRGGGDRREDRPNMYFPIFYDPTLKSFSMEPRSGNDVEILPKRGDGSDGRWRWGKDRVAASLDLLEARQSERKVRWDIDHRVYLNQFSSDENEDSDDELELAERTSKPKSVWLGGEFSTDVGKRAFKALLPDAEYDYPKAPELIKRCISMSTEDQDIVLDFFAGSATTAQALFEVNNSDSAQRHFVLVQFPEATGQKKFPTIAEIGKERIRRVSKKLKEEKAKGDLGLRVFKLAPSNFKQWHDYDGQDLDGLETQFAQFETPLVDGWTRENLLTEILLQQGFPLDSALTPQKEFTKNKIVAVASPASAHKLFVCLDEKIHAATIQQLKLAKRDVFICLDAALSSEAKVRLGDAANLVVI